jgi:hypothetical protein
VAGTAHATSPKRRSSAAIDSSAAVDKTGTIPAANPCKRPHTTHAKAAAAAAAAGAAPAAAMAAAAATSLQAQAGMQAQGGQGSLGRSQPAEVAARSANTAQPPAEALAALSVDLAQNLQANSAAKSSAQDDAAAIVAAGAEAQPALSAGAHAPHHPGNDGGPESEEEQVVEHPLGLNAHVNEDLPLDELEARIRFTTDDALQLTVTGPAIGQGIQSSVCSNSHRQGRDDQYCTHTSLQLRCPGWVVMPIAGV